MIADKSVLKTAALGRGLAAGLFLVAIGTPLTWAVFTFVPGMDVFRPYTRLAMWWCLAVALLGGVGLDLVVGRAQRWRRWAGPALAVAVIGVTAVQLLDYGPTGDVEYVLTNEASQANSSVVVGSNTNIGGGDFIRGEPGDDVIHGGDGDDVLTGGAGYDVIDGGPGNNAVTQ